MGPTVPEVSYVPRFTRRATIKATHRATDHFQTESEEARRRGGEGVMGRGWGDARKSRASQADRDKGWEKRSGK